MNSAGLCAVAPGSVRYYNTDPGEIERIRSHPYYSLLRQDIQRNGILNPILVEQERVDLNIHIGEQRLWLAAELGMAQLPGFVFTRGAWDILLNPYERVSHRDQVLRRFRQSLSSSKGGPQHASVNHFAELSAELQPAYRTIMRYIDEGTILL